MKKIGTDYISWTDSLTERYSKAYALRFLMVKLEISRWAKFYIIFKKSLRQLADTFTHATPVHLGAP